MVLSVVDEECRTAIVSPIDYPLTLMIGKGNYDESEDVEFVDPTYAIDPTEGMSEVDEFEEVKEPPTGTE